MNGGHPPVAASRAEQGSQGGPALPDPTPRLRALVNDVTALLAECDATTPQAVFDALAGAHEQLVSALALCKDIDQRRASLRLLFDMGWHGHACGDRETWVASKLAQDYAAACKCGGRVVPETNRGVEHLICTKCQACSVCDVDYAGRHRDDTQDGQHLAAYRDNAEAVHGTYYYGAHRPV